MRAEVDHTQQSTLDYRAAVAALESFGNERVLVSYAAAGGTPVGSVFGVLRQATKVDVGNWQPDELTVFDIGVSGSFFLSAQDYVGGMWRDELLALQTSPTSLVTIQRAARPDLEEGT